MKKQNHKMRLKRHIANTESPLATIYNSRPSEPAEVSRVMVDVRMCYERLKSGAGTEQDYRVVIFAVNIGMIRAEAIDTELVSYFLAAGEALMECGRLHARHDRYGFTGPGILAINAALEFYEQMLGLSSPNQMHAAAEEADRRYRAGDVITAA